MQFLKSYKGESMKSFLVNSIRERWRKVFYLPLLKSIYKIPDEDLVTLTPLDIASLLP